MQHKSCIEPTAAVSIDPAADHKGAELSAQPDPDPDPDRAAASSSAVGVSPTEDIPTMWGGNLSPMDRVGPIEKSF